MVAAGCLAIDMGAFGSLQLSARGRSLLDGRERFALRLDALRRATPSSGRGAPAGPPLAAADQGLLGELKALRSVLARERGVPAYIIFPDRTLHELVRHKPTTIEAFGAIHGVGQAKLRDFGAPFVATIKAQAAAG
jgi:ATP-dependent DNA helicase RecQ